MLNMESIFSEKKKWKNLKAMANSWSNNRNQQQGDKINRNNNNMEERKQQTSKQSGEEL